MLTGAIICMLLAGILIAQAVTIRLLRAIYSRLSAAPAREYMTAGEPSAQAPEEPAEESETERKMKEAEREAERQQVLFVQGISNILNYDYRGGSGDE